MLGATTKFSHLSCLLKVYAFEDHDVHAMKHDLWVQGAKAGLALNLDHAHQPKASLVNG